REAVVTAAQAVTQMREDEGRRLHVDLEERFASIERSLREIETLAPDRLIAERDRLRTAITELTDGISVNPDRIAQEIAILAERWDINEELVRFRSHLSLARELVESEDTEGVGKRLSF